MHEGAMIDHLSIEDIVKWRMGSAYSSSIIDWRSRFMIYESEEMLSSRKAAGFIINNGEVSIHAPHCASGYRPAELQRLKFLADNLEPALRSITNETSFFAQMGDAVWDLPILFRRRIPNVVNAVLSKQRVASLHSATQQAIIWPMPYEFKRDNTPTNSSVAWDQRDYRICWRGQTTGLSYDFGGTELPNMISIRKSRPWLAGWLEGGRRKGLDDFDDWANSYQRLAAAIRYKGHRDIDIRLTELSYKPGTRVLEPLADKVGPDICAERLPREDYIELLQGTKVRLAIPGNDSPSSLKSDLLSDSAVLMPKPFHENCWFFGLEPGQHYVEIRRDMSDLEEKLEWCRDNDALCREIAVEGQRHAAALFDPAVELEVQRRVLTKVSANTVLDLPWA